MTERARMERLQYEMIMLRHFSERISVEMSMLMEIKTTQSKITTFKAHFSLFF